MFSLACPSFAFFSIFNSNHSKDTADLVEKKMGIVQKFRSRKNRYKLVTVQN